MASIRTKFNVGIFVIIGFTIAAAAIIWFGMTDYLQEGRLFAAYFDESVQGLDKDSSVKYRGVTVGKVESIDVAPDDTLIQVVLKIEKDMKLTPDIVAQLKSVGITGIMFVELDVKNDAEPNMSPEISFRPEYPVVATKPSEFKKYMKSIENLLAQLNALDVKGISDRAKSTLDNINVSVNNAKIKEISDNITASFKKFEEILNPKQWQNVMKSIETAGTSLDSLIVNTNGAVSNINNAFVRFDKLVQHNESGLSNAINDFTLSVNRAGKFLGEGAGLLEKADQNLETLQKYMMSTLQNLEQASQDLKRSSEEIADQPSLLIFSKPLPERDHKNEP